MICKHTITEKIAARIDGLCPLCLKVEVERLKKQIGDLRAEGVRKLLMKHGSFTGKH
jgi:hypothetical protein